MTYDAIKSHRGRSNFRSKSQAEAGLTVQFIIASIVAKHTIKGIAQHMAKSAKNVVMTTTLNLSVKVD